MLSIRNRWRMGISKLRELAHAMVMRISQGCQERGAVVTITSSQATIDAILIQIVLAFGSGENSKMGSLYPGQPTSL